MDSVLSIGVFNTLSLFQSVHYQDTPLYNYYMPSFNYSISLINSFVEFLLLFLFSILPKNVHFSKFIFINLSISSECIHTYREMSVCLYFASISIRGGMTTIVCLRQQILVDHMTVASGTWLSYILCI